MAREIKWRGRTEEEIKGLDLREFMDLAPARIRRSLKRGFTESQKKLLKRIESNPKNVKTHCRNMVVIPSFIGLTLHVYDGQKFQPVEITMEMLGHYLGEFANPRKMVKHSSAGVGATRSSKAISAR